MNDFEAKLAQVRNNVGMGFGIGKTIPYALKTQDNRVYRVTGFSQIKDIVECGYVRPKGYGVRQKKVGDVVYWSIGNSKLYYIDKRPVLEAPIEKVKPNQIGAIFIEDLSAIWIYDEKEGCYKNCLDYYKQLYYSTHLEDRNIIRR